MQVDIGTVAGQRITFTVDFCEDCGECYEPEYLSKDGLRCGHCDPDGIAREGSAAE